MIQSGDTFEIMRLDGVHSMIAWALGAATGHVAIAMWRNQSLYICESTPLSVYWPLANGMQCNTYLDWITQAEAMSDNVVWAPLRLVFKLNFSTL